MFVTASLSTDFESPKTKSDLLYFSKNYIVSNFDAKIGEGIKLQNDLGQFDDVFKK